MFVASSLKSVSWFVVNLINELRTFNFPENSSLSAESVCLALLGACGSFMKIVIKRQ